MIDLDFTTPSRAGIDAQNFCSICIDGLIVGRTDFTGVIPPGTVRVSTSSTCAPAASTPLHVQTTKLMPLLPKSLQYFKPNHAQ